jgi:hypothetical protein
MMCHLAWSPPDATVRFTTDGSWPSPSAKKYTGPFALTETTTVRARAYLSNGLRGPVAIRSFEKTDTCRFVTPPRPFVSKARVILERPFGPAEVRYTLNGSPPSADSPVYRGPIEVTDSAVVSAALFHEGVRVGDVQQGRFGRVDGLQAVDVENPARGVTYEYFEGQNWERIPDFATLLPLQTGTVDRFTLDVPRRADQFALKFRGYLEVPADGFYTFYLQSDDGSRLVIGDRELVNHDGMHDARGEKKGTIALAAGKHRFTLTYFDGGLDETLAVRFEGPDIPKQSIPPDMLYHDTVAN